MDIRAIGFDYGGVIEGEPGSNFNKKASVFLGVDVETFRKSYFKFNTLANTGKINWDECWTMVLKDLGQENRIPEFLNAYPAFISRAVNEHMVQLIDKLRAAGYKVGILSNNTSERAAQIRSTGIGSHVDAMIVSAEIGYSKPDPNAFHAFFEKLGVSPAEAIFVDDSEHALANAKEVGFQPILFTDYEVLVATLKNLGIHY